MMFLIIVTTYLMTAVGAILRGEELVMKYNNWVDNIKIPSDWAKDMFTNDAEFVIGNFPPAVGHEQIANSAAGIYALVGSLKHVSTSIYSANEDTFIVEGTVTYHLKDGTPVNPIKLMSIFEMKPSTSLIQSYRAYVDLTPLFTAFQENAKAKDL